MQMPKNNTKQMIQQIIHCILCYLCVTTEVVTTDDVCITFLPDTSTASHTFPVISLNKGQKLNIVKWVESEAIL